MSFDSLKEQNCVLKPGEKVNYFTVLKVRKGLAGHGQRATVKCQCGQKLSMPAWLVKKRWSCGCMAREVLKKNLLRLHERNKTQNNYTQLYPSEYASYNAMLRRCYNKKEINYENYGGRGIRVCKRWRKGEENLTGFQCFVSDMGRKRFGQYSLDRIDPDKGYSPRNCRWADKWAQANNQRQNVWSKLEKREISLEQACSHYGVKRKIAGRFFTDGGKARDLVNLNRSILAIDPGLKNFSICWIKNGRVKWTYYLQNTLKEIKNNTIQTQADSFTQEIRDLLELTKPDILIIERFMVRRFSAKIIELIGMMVGWVTALCYHYDISLKLVTSSQWKIPIKRLGSLDRLYELAKKQHGLDPHQVDALCMGRYVMSHNTYHPDDHEWIKKNLANCTLQIA